MTTPPAMLPPGLKLPPGLSSSSVPTLQHYNRHLASLCEQRADEAAKQAFLNMKAQNIQPNTDTYINYISVLAKAENTREILTVFQEMVERKIILPSNLYETISRLFNQHLKALCASSFQPQEILSKLETVGLPLNIHLFTSCLSIYASRPQPHTPQDRYDVLEILGKMKKLDLEPNEVTKNVLRKFPDLEGSWSVRSESSRITLAPSKSPPAKRLATNVSLQHEHLPDSEKTLLLVEDMFRYTPLSDPPDSSPELIRYNKQLAQAAKTENLEEALRIFSDILDRKLEPDVRTYTSYILVLLKANREEEALTTFESMKQRGIQPDATIRKTFLDYYHFKIPKLTESKNRQGIEQLVTKIQDIGLIPNKFTHTYLAQAYISLEDASSIYKMIEEIEKRLLPPSVTLFHVLISFFWKRREFDMVKRIICFMNESGFLVNPKKLQLPNSTEDKENLNARSSPDPDLKFFDLLSFLDTTENQIHIQELHHLIELNYKLHLTLSQKDYFSAVQFMLRHPALFRVTQEKEAYHLLLWCYIRRDTTEEIFDILTLLPELKQEQVLNLDIGFALIEHFFKQKDPKSAFEIAKRMHQAQCLTDIYHYNYLLALFVNRRESQAAWTIFGFMKEKGLKFNTLTLHLLLDLYVLEKQFDEAANLFNVTWPNYQPAKRGSNDLLECYNCSLGYALTLILQYVNKNPNFQRFFILTEKKPGYLPSKSVKWRIEDDLKVFIQKHLHLTIDDTTNQRGLLRVENKRTM